MNVRVQKLCKRLNKFTLEEISLIAELDKSAIKPILNGLVKSNFLNQQSDVYIYIGKIQRRKNEKCLPLMLQYHSQETIGMIIKCFCAEISSPKAGLILTPSANCIGDFNLFFRKAIYEKQKQKLLQHFKNQPQLPRLRTFFNQTFYFYYYNDYLYISDELLTDENAQNFSKNEIKQFKIMYSLLCRRLNHNSSKYYTPFHIAEKIWRHEKSFEQLKNELYSDIFNN